MIGQIPTEIHYRSLNHFFPFKKSLVNRESQPPLISVKRCTRLIPMTNEFWPIFGLIHCVELVRAK